MSYKQVCDICKKGLNINDINIEYKKVRAKRHAFDGLSRTFTYNIDVCEKCISKIEKLRSKEND